MYELKRLCEDFIVHEITSVKPKDSGKYIYFWLTKKNYALIKALQTIANVLHIKLKNIGFAGTKDKKAVTKQLISIYGTTKKKIERLELKDIFLEFYGYGDEPISLGNLEYNEFIITIRNIDKKPITEKTGFINYFGEQRFSRNNSEIGKSFIKKDFKQAVELILESDGYYENDVKRSIIKNPNNFVGAIRLIPKKILKMFVHAYQSKLWNLTADYCIKNKKDVDKIPLVGFATYLEDANVSDFIEQKLKEDKITLRDFIIPTIPELSSEGTLRKFKIKTKINIQEYIDDELNKNKKKAIIKFKLPKGSYATEIIKQLF